MRSESGKVAVIGHRGACGYLPEHTLAAYALAIDQGADFIEPDLVVTRDGVLVARHENEISGTTDVAQHPELAGRHTSKTIDGIRIDGWFTEDLTLAELKTLRAVERLPGTRPENTAFDGLFEVPTLEEVIDLARSSRTADGRVVGVYAETKHPSYFASIGLPMEEELGRVLDADQRAGPRAPVRVQSFEVGHLQRLSRMTGVSVSQLVSCRGAPADFAATGDGRSYADLVTPAGLAFVATYADAVGACKDVLIPRSTDGSLGPPSPVISDAHDAGLGVNGWTFRRENRFLPLDHRLGTDPDAVGDVIGEMGAFLAAGIDGFFTDNPDLGTTAAERFAGALAAR